MAKTIQTHLSPEIIADFESSFETPQDQRKYLYDKITQKINSELGDVFQTKTCNKSIIENGQRVSKPATLDEINFEKTEVPSNVSWRTKGIAGELVPFEFMIGASLWDKIRNHTKLFYLMNRIFNQSIMDDSNSALEKLKTDGKATAGEIKAKEKQLKEGYVTIEKMLKEDCMEGYIYNLLSKPMIDKIKENEKKREVDEESALSKSLFEEKKPKR